MMEGTRLIGQHEYDWLASLCRRAEEQKRKGWNEMQLIMPKRRVKGFPYGEKIAEYEAGKASYAVNCEALLKWAHKRMNAEVFINPMCSNDRGRA